MVTRSLPVLSLRFIFFANSSKLENCYFILSLQATCFLADLRLYFGVNKSPTNGRCRRLIVDRICQLSFSFLVYLSDQCLLAFSSIHATHSFQEEIDELRVPKIKLENRCTCMFWYYSLPPFIFFTPASSFFRCARWHGSFLQLASLCNFSAKAYDAPLVYVKRRSGSLEITSDYSQPSKSWIHCSSDVLRAPLEPLAHFPTAEGTSRGSFLTVRRLVIVLASSWAHMTCVSWLQRDTHAPVYQDSLERSNSQISSFVSDDWSIYR